MTDNQKIAELEAALEKSLTDCQNCIAEQDKRIAELQEVNEQLLKAIIGLREDGSWISGIWVPSDSAYEAADAAIDAAMEGEE
jgi:tRNA pseudouridine-54 N-methylase